MESMVSRRSCLLSLGILPFATVDGAKLLFALDELVLPELVTPVTREAIQAGLAWLASRQQVSGAFGQVDEFSQNLGVTSLCGMAFLISGSVPRSGPYREVVAKTLRFVLSRAMPNGYLAEGDSPKHGPMYGHGFATMFLAEVYGMVDEPAVRDVLKRAVDLIIATQNEEGGWRYFPVPDEADISVTVCQVMALRAARNKGIAVPKETIDRAVAYIRGCQNPDGGFRYRLLDAGDSKFPRTAAALVALYTSGVYDEQLNQAGLGFLQRYAKWDQQRQVDYFFYAQYYAALAAWHAGDEVWRDWYPVVRDGLISLRENRDHWTDPQVGAEYATAMALIVLQLPYNYVPIFER